MARLSNNTRVYGNLYVDKTIIAGAGAMGQSRSILTTFSYLPAALCIPGAKFKLTLIGGGGGGGGCSTAAAVVAGGGGSGGVLITIITVVQNQYSYTTTTPSAGAGGVGNLVGNAGTPAVFTYNGVSYTAGGGAGGATTSGTPSSAAGGSVSGGIINLTGGGGGKGPASLGATIVAAGQGGHTPLGWGIGGLPGTFNTLGSSAGTAGSGYGAGGGGAFNSTGGTALNGGSGATGVIFIEY